MTWTAHLQDLDGFLLDSDDISESMLEDGGLIVICRCQAGQDPDIPHINGPLFVEIDFDMFETPDELRTHWNLAQAAAKGMNLHAIVEAEAVSDAQ